VYLGGSSSSKDQSAVYNNGGEFPLLSLQDGQVQPLSQVSLLWCFSLVSVAPNPILPLLRFVVSEGSGTVGGTPRSLESGRKFGGGHCCLF
jgi:hypothetical protein